MQAIDEEDKHPRDDSPAHAGSGQTPQCTNDPAAFNAVPSETLRNFKLKVQLAHATKWPSSKWGTHISQDAAVTPLRA